VFSVCFVRRSSGQILLPRYLANGSNSFDRTYTEYSLAHTDDLVRCWRSRVKVKYCDRHYLMNYLGSLDETYRE